MLDLDTTSNLYCFAILHGYKARINGGSVVVWDNDGYVSKTDKAALVDWLDGLEEGLEDRLLIIIEQIKATK